MTREQRALLKSVQKVRGVLDRYPDGVSLSQITGDTQLSSGAARAALLHMKAECEDGLWFDVAVDDVEQSGNAGELEPEPVTIAESAPVEPVTIEPQLELKKLTQAVFDGLPPEYRWAVIGKNGAALAWVADPVIENGLFWATPAWDWTGAKLIGRGYDTSNWRNSKIERLSDTCIDDMGIANFQKECQRVADQQAKSDFAVALEAERQRVYDAVAIGGTVERLAELTGLHVDDVQQHLDALIVDGAIYQKPIVIAMSYGVMG